MSNIEHLYHNYLRHQKGLALLWFWMEQWKDLDGWVWSNSELHLSSLASQRFVLGSPRPNRNVHSGNVFLGVQSDEAAWIKRIEWSRCVWDRAQQRLWLISTTHKSPDQAWPDLPPLSVGLYVEALEQIGEWKGPRLDLRGVWWDEENDFHVDGAPNQTLGVKLGSLNELWSAKERQSVESLRDVVLARLSRSNVEYDPGFSGERPQVSSEYSGIIKPYESKNEKFVEYNYPQLFGQFLEDNDPSKK